MKTSKQKSHKEEAIAASAAAAAVKAAASVPTNKPRGVRVPIKAHGHRVAESSDAYTEMLARPFTASLRPLGFGTLVPTTVMQGFRRIQLAPGSTTKSFVFAMCPTANVMVRYWEATDSSLALGNPLHTYDPTNKSQITAMAQLARVINGGLRVRVRYAATSPAGSLAGFYTTSDSITNLQALSPDSLMALDSATWLNENLSGSCAIEVQYRPDDYYSFVFGASPLSGYNSANAAPMLVVIGTGWVAGSFNIETQAVMGLESQSGLLGSGADIPSAKVEDPDAALRKATRAPPPTFSLDSIGQYAARGWDAFQKVHHAYAMYSKLSKAAGLRDSKTSDDGPPAQPVVPNPDPFKPDGPPPSPPQPVAPASSRRESFSSLSVEELREAVRASRK